MGRSEQGIQNQKEYIKKYKAENYKHYTVLLRNKEDANLIAFLDKNKKKGVSAVFRKALKEYVKE